jgi:hypothetical protein
MLTLIVTRVLTLTYQVYLPANCLLKFLLLIRNDKTMSTRRNFPIKTTTTYYFSAKFAIELFLILLVATLSFELWTTVGGGA